MRRRLRRGLEAVEFVLVGGLVLPLILILPPLFALTISTVIGQHAMTQTAIYTASRGAWSTALQDRCAAMTEVSYGVNSATCTLFRDASTGLADPGCAATVRSDTQDTTACRKVIPVRCGTRTERVADCLGDAINNAPTAPPPDWKLPRGQHYRLVVEFNNPLGTYLGLGDTTISRSVALVSEARE